MLFKFLKISYFPLKGIWANRYHTRHYQNNVCNSKIYKRLYAGKINESFSTKIRLKQGDVLTTLLFNLHVNDLPDFLDKESNTEKKDTLHLLIYVFES